MQTLKSNFAFLELKNKNGASSLFQFLKEFGSLEDGEPVYFVGDAVNLYSDLLQNLPFKIMLANENQSIISSITIAKLGYTKYQNGNYGDSSVLSPIYLRKSQAELALEEKQK